MTLKSIDISPRDLDTVRSILHCHVPNHEVWAFGSRVRWTAHTYSDLDLAIRSVSPIPTSILSALREEFSESNLPMKVDVLDVASVDEKFRKLIEEEYAVIYPRNSVALSEVAKITMGQSPLGSTYNTDGIGFLFYQGVADFQDRYPKKRVFCIAPTRFAEQGDVLLSVRAPIGRVNLAIDRCAIGRGLASIRAIDFEDQTFLEFALRHESENWRILESQGSVFGNAKKSDLMNLSIPWPKRERRRFIARVLGALDDKIEINRKMNTTIESIAQALFQSWFVDFAPVYDKSKGRTPGLPTQIAALFPSEFENSSLGPIPKGWEVSHLSDICSLNPLRSLRQGEVAPYLDMKNMPTLGPCPNEVVNRKFTSGSRFENGDTLLARITPCLENGKTAYVQHLAEHQTGWGSTEFIVLRPHSPIPPIFAYYLARSDRFRSFAIQRMTGSSGRQRVDSSSLSGFNLAIPPDEIFIEFGKLLSPAMKSAHANAQNSKHLSQIRDSLLPKLLSGELRVKG